MWLYANTCSIQPQIKVMNSMFPDSGIAKNFSYGKTNCGFIVKFGIAP